MLRGQLTFRTALTEVGERLGVAIPPALIQQACDDRTREKSTIFQRIDPAVADVKAEDVLYIGDVNLEHEDTKSTKTR